MSWAKLRQVIIATEHMETDADALRGGLGLGQGFPDPELKEHSMADITLPLADESYLQLLTPLDEADSLARWLGKIGGRGGYALSIQHPDPASVKARAEARDVGVIRAIDALGYPIVQLHPRDTGILLEVDGIADPDVWFWDDLGQTAEPDAAVDAIVGVEVSVDDPDAMGSIWHELLDLPAGDSPRSVDLGGRELLFRTGGKTPEWTITLRRSGRGGAVPAPDLIPGITFRYVD